MKGPISLLQELSDSFFDGLKKDAINTAIKRAKKTKRVPVPIVQKMQEIDKLAAELKQMLDEYDK